MRFLRDNLWLSLINHYLVNLRLSGTLFFTVKIKTIKNMKKQSGTWLILLSIIMLLLPLISGALYNFGYLFTINTKFPLKFLDVIFDPIIFIFSSILFLVFIGFIFSKEYREKTIRVTLYFLPIILILCFLYGYFSYKQEITNPNKVQSEIISFENKSEINTKILRAFSTGILVISEHDTVFYPLSDIEKIAYVNSAKSNMKITRTFHRGTMVTSEDGTVFYPKKE